MRGIAIVLFVFLPVCQLRGSVYLGPCKPLPPLDEDVPDEEGCVFVPEERVSWTAAPAVCHTYDAQVMRVPDRATNDRLHAVLGQLTVLAEPWIDQAVTHAEWHWTTGNPLLKTAGVCSGPIYNSSVTTRMEAGRCFPWCLSQQYTWASHKGLECRCYNGSYGDSPFLPARNATCDEGETTPSERHKVYPLQDSHLLNWSALADRHSLCGVLRVRGTSRTVTSRGCEEKLKFICKHGSNITSQNPSSFFEARRLCQSEGSDLWSPAVSLNTTALFNTTFYPGTSTLFDPTSDQEEDFWVGLTRFSVVSYDGKETPFNSFTHLSILAVGSCVFVSPQSARGQWFNDRCSEKKPPLCWLQRRPEEDRKLDQAGGNINISGTKTDWLEAMDMCGHPVTIDNVRANWELFEQLPNIAISRFENVWIGIWIRKQDWTTVYNARLYELEGCCPGTALQNITELTRNSAVLCVSHCKHYRFSYVQQQKCGCSMYKPTCTTQAEMCTDKCQGNSYWVDERCGNIEARLYSVYRRNEALDFPDWRPPRFSYSVCGALEVNGGSALLNGLPCRHPQSYLCFTANGNVSVGTGKASWLKARLECLARGGDLANLHVNSPVLASLPPGIYWVGLSQFSIKSHTGEHLLFHRINNDTFEDRLVGTCIGVNPQQPGEWLTLACSEKNRVLCFKDGAAPTQPPTSVSAVRPDEPQTPAAPSTSLRPPADPQPSSGKTPPASPPADTSAAPPTSREEKAIAAPIHQDKPMIVVMAVLLSLVVIVIAVVALHRFRRTQHATMDAVVDYNASSDENGLVLIAVNHETT